MKYEKIWAEPKWDGGAVLVDDKLSFTYRTIEPEPIAARVPEDGRLAADISAEETTE